MSLFISNFSARSWQALGCALLASTLAAWLLLVAIYDRPNWKSLAVASLQQKHDLLFLGSSRVVFGINPDRFKRPTVNLACDYLDGTTMLRLWRTYQPQLDEAAVVVLEGGLAPYFYHTKTLAPDSLRDLGLSVWPGWQEVVQDPGGIIRAWLWPFFRWRMTPRFWTGFQDFHASPYESFDAAPGYVPSRLELTYPEEYAAREIKKAEQVRLKTAASVVDANRQAIDVLIGELLASGRQVVWMRFPVHSAVWPHFPAPWRQEVRDEKARLARKFPALTIIDLWDHAAFTQKEFRDPDHLNAQGADRLADLLNQQLAPLFP